MNRTCRSLFGRPADCSLSRTPDEILTALWPVCSSIEKWLARGRRTAISGGVADLGATMAQCPRSRRGAAWGLFLSGSAIVAPPMGVSPEEISRRRSGRAVYVQA